MPLIYRAMRAEGNLPLVGHVKGDTLGVREIIMKGDKEEGDIKPVNGMVHPETGGMSVSPAKSPLPVARRLPSGDQDTEHTQLVCPLRPSNSRPSAASHTFAVISRFANFR
jgi:hypothetical protein